MILCEKALFVIPMSPGEFTNEKLATKIEQLAPDDREQLLCLRKALGNELKKLTRLCDWNIFSLSENPWTPATTIGVFVLLSRFNHSCRPNANVPILARSEKDTLSMFATKKIDTGEEITFCYEPSLVSQTKAERQETLGDYFACACRLCASETPLQTLISDKRRRLARGLEYLMAGRDAALNVPQTRLGVQSPIIVDPELRKAAEEFKIPLCNRLCHQLLLMALLDAEGLLDDYTLEKAICRLSLVSSALGTPNNIRVGARAMAQDTWFESFAVACNVFGATDANDDAFAARLRADRAGR